MEAFETYRAAVLKALTDESQKFEGALRKVLAERMLPCLNSHMLSHTE